MKNINLRQLVWLIAAAVLVGIGMSACSESMDEPVTSVQEQSVAGGSRMMPDGRELIEGICTLKYDTIKFIYDKQYAKKFVPFDTSCISAEYKISKDDIKVISAYSYDVKKYGTELDPWINLNIEPMDLPTEIEWITAEIDTVDDELGIRVEESENAPDLLSECIKYHIHYRVLKLNLLVGLNDSQCTVCSLVIVQYDVTGGYFTRDDEDLKFYNFAPDSEIIVESEGGSGTITMSYNEESYKAFTEESVFLPESIQFKSLKISERIGDPVQEAIDRGRMTADIWNNKGWTIFDAEKVFNADGECDLGWAKIKISNNPDGTKRFDYYVTKNSTGKKRQIRISGTSFFKGPEVSFYNSRDIEISWKLYILQRK